MSLAVKILAGLLVVGVIAVVLVLLLTGEDEVKGQPLWVVVGNDGGGFGSIMFSKSGKKWTDSSNKGASFRGTGSGVAYGLSSDKKTGLWVATGDSGIGACAGNILFSTDGQKWEQSNGEGASFRDYGKGLAYGLSSDKKTGLWVAVGRNTTGGACAGNILFSTDGKKWEPSNDSGASFRFEGYGVAYGLSSDKKTGLWVATGDNYTNAYTDGTGACAGNILFSTDGQFWTQSVESGASFRGNGNGVAYGLSSDKKTGLWVATGYNYTEGGGEPAGNILFSTDGKKWTQSDPNGASFRGAGNGVAYGLSSDKKTGLWVAVGDNKTPANFGTGAYAGNILFSTDGKKWEQSNGEGASFATAGSGVAYGLDEDNNPLWVAVGNNDILGGGGTRAGNVLFSRDGKFWQQSNPSGASFAYLGSGAAFGKILNVALQ